MCLVAVLLVAAGGYGVYNFTGTLGLGGSSYSGPVSYVEAASMSTDGSQVAAIRRFDVIEAWNTDDGTLISRFKFEDKPRLVLPAGADGFLVFTDKGLVKWQPQKDSDGTSMQPVTGLSATIRNANVVLLPDGKTAYLFRGKNATVFDLAEQKEVRSFKTETTLPESTTVSPDQKYLVFGDREGKVHLLAGSDGKKLGELPASKLFPMENGKNAPRITNVVFSSDSRYLAVSLQTGVQHIIDMEDKLKVLKTTRQPITKMAFHPSKPSLISVGQEVHVMASDFSDTKAVPNVKMDRPKVIQLSPGGRYIMAFADEKPDLWVVDLDEMKLKQHLGPNPRL